MDQKGVDNVSNTTYRFETFDENSFQHLKEILDKDAELEGLLDKNYCEVIKSLTEGLWYRDPVTDSITYYEPRELLLQIDDQNKLNLLVRATDINIIIKASDYEKSWWLPSIVDKDIQPSK